MSAEALLLDLALGKETEARRYHARMQDYLAALPVALRALFTAAAGGNVTCREACGEIERILGKPVQASAPEAVRENHPMPAVLPPAGAGNKHHAAGTQETTTS